MPTAAKTVAQYVALVPEERRKDFKAVHAFVRKHVPKGYEEMFLWGMIVWAVPLKVYPDTYNKQPLAYAALANQKQYMALYLMCSYAETDLHAMLEKAFKAAGKKFDMGKSCLRFKTADDLVMKPIGEVLKALPMKKYIEISKAVHGGKKKK